MQAGAANMEHVEAPHSKFVDLVKNLLNNPDERHHFFQVSVIVPLLIGLVYQCCRSRFNI